MIRGLVVMALCAAGFGCGEPGDGAAEEAGEQPEWHALEGSWQRNGGGDVTEEDGILRLNWGERLTAARWTGDVPAGSWEFRGEARRIDGTDFFFSLTFPVKERHATLIVGGWGGSVVGISSVDGRDASENETTTLRRFETGTWHDIRLRAGRERLEAWIDGERVVDLALEGRELSLRPGPIDRCLPFGVATWQTTGEMRDLRWRELDGR